MADIAHDVAGRQARKLPRLDYLDALRAAAVLTVFVMHVSEIFVRIAPEHKATYDLAQDLNFGRVGVVTFFAISGFLIPSSLHGLAGPGLLRFVVTRVCRLYPAFLLSLVPSFATYNLMTQGVDYTTRDVLMNLTMVPRLFDAPMANGAYWTLEVEIAFYVVCAFLFAGGVLRNTFVLAALTAGLSVVFYTSQAEIWGGLLNPALSGDAFFFCLNLACMFWGAALRRWWDGDRLNTLTVALLAVFSAYWLLYLPIVLLLDRTGLVPRPGIDPRLISGYSLGLGLFALGLFVVRVRVRAISWFGRISYSFYLTHQAGLYVPYWLALHHQTLQHRPMPLYILASFVTSTTLAAASFYLVERPFIRVGRRLVRRLETRAASAPAAATAAPG